MKKVSTGCEITALFRHADPCMQRRKNEVFLTLCLEIPRLETIKSYSQLLCLVFVRVVDCFSRSWMCINPIKSQPVGVTPEAKYFSEIFTILYKLRESVAYNHYDRKKVF